jgi:hypothetical protein
MKLDRKLAREIKAEAIRSGHSLRDVAAEAGLTAERLGKIMSGDRDYRPGELTRVAAAIKRLSVSR